MLLRLVAVTVFATAAPLSRAQITISASLDPSAPAGVVTADLFANPAPSDAWALAGIRAVAHNGATFRFAGVDDPNSPYPDFLIAPYGNGPVTDQHVTCFSRPRLLRTALNRFNSNAGADLDGRYHPPGPASAIVGTPTELNLAWISNPFPGPSSPSVDGYFARISMNLPQSGGTLGVGHPSQIPPEATLLMLCDEVGAPGVLATSYDNPSGAALDWAVWYMPPECSADLNNSGTVDLTDLTTLLSNYGQPASPAEGDLDGNGLVNLDDLVILLGNFGVICG